MANRLRSYFTQSVDRLLARQPYLFALCLALRNQVLRSADRRRVAAAALATAIVGSAMVLAVALLAPQVQGWIAYLDAHASWLIVLTVLHAASSVARRRTHTNTAFRESWLAAAPRSVLTRRWALVLVVMWVPIAQLVVLVALLLMVQYVAASDATVVRHLMALIVGSYIGGTVLGAVFARKRSHRDQPGSRYIPGRRSKACIRPPASLSALGHWPIASAFAWATPDTVRWPVMVAMLSVMSGSSALVGLLVVGFWLLMTYMLTLFRLTLRVARQAAIWLRSTPISFGRFAVAVGCRSLVHQVLAAMLVAVCIAIDTRSPLQSVLLVAPWIALVLVGYTTTITYAFNARRGARVGIALSAVSLAAFEYAYRGAAVPMALFICVWQFRTGVHANHGKRLSYVT